jgi:hypothetical protein
MDCEKFEPLLLDELYEELDELTSAAVKRHVAGCARCSAILGGMQATRRAVSVPLVPAPVDLEDRILAAAKEAQKAIPIRSRMSGILSVAGSWAMRPQTAMAAVFLLMIGTSAFLIRSKNYASKDAAVSVTVAGAPAPTEEAAPSESLDDKAAAAAHGPTPPNITRPPAMPAAAVALGDEGSGPVDRLTGGAARDKSKEDEAQALASAFDSNALSKDSKGYAPAATAAPNGIANAGTVAGTALPANADGYAQAPAQPSKRAGVGSSAQDASSLGAAAFRARNFAEATRQYDIAAQSGDTNAALWAAESTREGQGCAVALGRFDQLARSAADTWVGNEASLRAARCQMAMDQLDAARGRLEKLAQSSSHRQQAEHALGELNQVAARKAGGGGASGGAAAAKPRAAAPAAAPPAPVRAPAESQEQKKAADHATSY